jgi:hypothetical protein
MDDGDRYTVTVVTSSEKRAGAPFREQLTARTVTLAASGTLFVDGRTDGKVRARTFQPDSWVRFEVRRIRMEGAPSPTLSSHSAGSSVG